MNRLVISALVALTIMAGLETATAAAQEQVAAVDKKFSVAEIRVTHDDMVIFANQDKVVHQIFSVSDGLRFNLKRLPPGSASGVKFVERGVAEVRCAIHRDMRMKVIVE
jgi:plastocyanin